MDYSLCIRCTPLDLGRGRRAGGGGGGAGRKRNTEGKGGLRRMPAYYTFPATFYFGARGKNNNQSMND